MALTGDMALLEMCQCGWTLKFQKVSVIPNALPPPRNRKITNTISKTEIKKVDNIELHHN